MANSFKPDTALKRLQEFDFARARVSLWVFRKPATSDNRLAFAAVWVDITKSLSDELKVIAADNRGSFTEVGAYGLLEQPNEAELLALLADGSGFTALADATAGREDANQATDLKALNNAAGYLVRIKTASGTLFCVRKATSDWRAKKSESVLNLLFVQKQLDIAEDPVLRIARTFDFFAIDEFLLIANKRAFESLLNYKTTYENSFVELQSESEFANVFSDLKPLQTFVGTNSIHLRRMAVVRDRGYYKDAQYLQRLQLVNSQRGWGIVFDSQGRITPTDATARVIVQVLLNHRLFSELSLESYDVPSTTPV